MEFIAESGSESYLNMLNSWKFNFVVIKNHRKHKIFPPENFLPYTVAMLILLYDAIINIVNSG